MPFKISKISIIESVEGIENQGTEEKWNFNVNENNDIYIYLEKNSAYGKTEIIDSVELKDIKAIKEKDNKYSSSSCNYRNNRQWMCFGKEQ